MENLNYYLLARNWCDNIEIIRTLNNNHGGTYLWAFDKTEKEGRIIHDRTSINFYEDYFNISIFVGSMNKFEKNRLLTLFKNYTINYYNTNNLFKSFNTMKVDYSRISVFQHTIFLDSFGSKK